MAYLLLTLGIVNFAAIVACLFLLLRQKTKDDKRQPNKDAIEVLHDMQRGGAILRVHHIPGDSVFLRSPRS